MHKVGLPPELVEKMQQRRGRERLFTSLDPSVTALLVVDMQQFFIDAVETARGVVPNINRLAHDLRAAGGLIVWIRASHTTEGRGAWTMFFDNFIVPEQGAEIRKSLSPGHPAHEFFAELDIHEGDAIVDKDRFSAFVATRLDSVLKARNIENVLVTGTNTNVCCESTARDAMMRDYRTLMIEDANAAFDDEDHIAGLWTFVQVFGDVVTTDQAVELLRA